MCLTCELLLRSQLLAYVGGCSQARPYEAGTALHVSHELNHIGRHSTSSVRKHMHATQDVLNECCAL